MRAASAAGGDVPVAFRAGEAKLDPAAGTMTICLADGAAALRT